LLLVMLQWEQNGRPFNALGILPKINTYTVSMRRSFFFLSSFLPEVNLAKSVVLELESVCKLCPGCHPTKSDLISDRLHFCIGTPNFPVSPLAHGELWSKRAMPSSGGPGHLDLEERSSTDGGDGVGDGVSCCWSNTMP
jgi:hypothetical protein